MFDHYVIFFNLSRCLKKQAFIMEKQDQSKIKRRQKSQLITKDSIKEVTLLLLIISVIIATLLIILSDR